MFSRPDEPNVLKRYGTKDDEHVEGLAYFVEDVATGARLLDSRPFPTVMAAYLALSTVLQFRPMPLRIVDDHGDQVYASACAHEASPAWPSQA